MRTSARHRASTLGRALFSALAALLAACTATVSPGPRTSVFPAAGALLPASFDRGVFVLYADLPGQRRQQPLLLDTGTDRTLLDVELAGALGLQREGHESIVTATGVAVPGVRLQRLDWLRLGDARFEDIDAVGVDLSSLRDHGGLPIVGIAGCDLFRQGLLEIDYVAGTVRLLPRTAAPTEGGHAFAERTPWVALEIAGEPIRALVDTGFQQALALPPGTALPWRRPPRASGDIATIDGTAARSLARLHGEVTLGELSWRDPWVVVVPGTPKLGALLLRRCVVRLDIAGGRIWIARAGG